MPVKIYDTNEVSITFAGRAIDGGYADGEFCRVVYDEDGFTKVTGTDGSVTRSKSNNRGAKVTITLMQTADANNILSALYNLDLLNGNGAGVAPLMIRDRNGLTVHVTDAAWITKLPDTIYDKEAGPRAWVLDCGALEGFQGGN